jgi:integrase
MPRPNLGPRLVPARKPGRRTIYIIRWTEAGRDRERSTGTGDPAAAQAFFEDWLVERGRLRRLGKGDPAQVRVTDVLRLYAEQHGPELANPGALLAYLQPLQAFFEGVTIATMTPAKVKEYWAWRRSHSVRTFPAEIGRPSQIVASEVSDGTIIRELRGVLRPAIQHAIRAKALAAGAYYVPVPPMPPGRDLWITRHQAARLLWESRRDKRSRMHLPLFIQIGLYTGQRASAILGLTWSQIDLVRGRINFNPPGRVQTAKRRPIIPVPRPLLATLRRRHAQAQRERSRRESEAVADATRSAVFVPETDTVIAYQGKRLGRINDGFATAAKRAGIPACTPHTLRHTAGTWMAQAGVSMTELGGYLGHSFTRTTELYAHHHPDYMENARRTFE